MIQECIFVEGSMSTWREKIEKARFHSVISMGTKEQRFEVSCRDRTGQGVRRQRVIQEVLITIDGRVFCRCQKPKVHHLPCSHVIAACSRTVTLTRSAHSFQYPLLLPRLDLPGIRRMDRLHLQEFAASSCARNSLQYICVYETKYIMYLSRIWL